MTTPELTVAFTLSEIWTSANVIIAKLMPVLYIVIGIGVGSWLLRKVRGMF